MNDKITKITTVLLERFDGISSLSDKSNKVLYLQTFHQIDQVRNKEILEIDKLLAKLQKHLPNMTKTQIIFYFITKEFSEMKENVAELRQSLHAKNNETKTQITEIKDMIKSLQQLQATNRTEKLCGSD